MIYESSYWKDELSRLIKDLRKKSNQKRWYESSFASLEKSTMLSCYIARKLFESKKITPSVFDIKIELLEFPKKGKPTDFLNRHYFWELYDMDKGTRVQKDFSFVVNQIIHSFVFQPDFGEHSGKLIGLFFNSDMTRQKNLYLIDIKKLIEALSKIAESYITKIKAVRTKDGFVFESLEEN